MSYGQDLMDATKLGGADDFFDEDFFNHPHSI